MQSICVYCGSSDQVSAKYLAAARNLGEEIARRGMEVIYGGGKTGLMGAVAAGAMDAGGQVIGVIPKMFYTPQLAQTSLSQLEVVADMHTRKARMAELADGFIALPGGFGTFEEWFEALTWAQIGLHAKPIGLLNVDGYYDGLLAFVAHALKEGFIYEEHRALFVAEANAENLLDALAAYQPPSGLGRWVQRADE